MDRNKMDDHKIISDATNAIESAKATNAIESTKIILCNKEISFDELLNDDEKVEQLVEQIPDHIYTSAGCKIKNRYKWSLQLELMEKYFSKNQENKSKDYLKDAALLLTAGEGNVEMFIKIYNYIIDEQVLKCRDEKCRDEKQFNKGENICYNEDSKDKNAKDKGDKDEIKVLKFNNKIHYHMISSVMSFTGKIEIAKLILQTVPDIIEESNSDAITQACYAGQLDMVKFLIGRNLERNVHAYSKWFLKDACHGGHKDIIDYLVSINSKLIILDWDNALIGACAGYEDCVEKSISEIHQGNDRYCEQERANRHCERHFQLVKYTLQHGAKSFSMQFYNACRSGSIILVKYFISLDKQSHRNISLDRQSNTIESDVKNANENEINWTSALYIACESDQFEIVKLLIESFPYTNCDFNDAMGYSSPKCRRIIILLINSGASNLGKFICNLKVSNDDGESMADDCLFYCYINNIDLKAQGINDSDIERIKDKYNHIKNALTLEPICMIDDLCNLVLYYL